MEEKEVVLRTNVLTIYRLKVPGGYNYRYEEFNQAAKDWVTRCAVFVPDPPTPLLALKSETLNPSVGTILKTMQKYFVNNHIFKSFNANIKNNVAAAFNGAKQKTRDFYNGR